MRCPSFIMDEDCAEESESDGLQVLQWCVHNCTLNNDLQLRVYLSFLVALALW